MSVKKHKYYLVKVDEYKLRTTYTVPERLLKFFCHDVEEVKKQEIISIKEIP